MLAKGLRYWRKLATGSVNGRILSAVIIIVAATAAVKLTAMGKDMVVAASFGLGDDLDAFLIAFLIPFFASSVIGLSFDGAFLPGYVRLSEREGTKPASRLFANIMVANFGLMLACYVVLAIAGAPLVKLVASEFPPEKLALTRDLYFILLPMIVLDGQITLWASVLNARERFALVAFAPIMTPLVIIATLLLIFPEMGVRALAWATLAGSGAELTLLGYALMRRGLLPIPRWYRSIMETAAVFKQYVPLVLNGLIMSGCTVVDQTMAAWLGTGSVAALNYGNKIPGFLAGIGITALGTAVLPYFARLVAVGDREAIRHTLRVYMRWILLLVIPVTLVFITSSLWIVKLLFERGAFGSDDTKLVAYIQQMYLLQVPFVVLGMLGVRLLTAMSQNHLLLIMSIVMFVVNIVGNLLFMRWLGVAGIALSTSLMYLVSMVMILVLVHRRLNQMHVSQPVAA